MSAFPAYVQILFADFGEEFDPSVLVSDMDRGPSKERIENDQVKQQLAATLYFDSKGDIAAFETWYFTDIKRIGYFDLVHPRTGQVVSAHFPGGAIGRLKPLNPQYTRASRPVTFEYLR